MLKYRLILSGLALANAMPAWGQTLSPLDEGRVDREQPTVPDPSASPERHPAVPGAAAEVEAEETAAPIRSIRFVGTEVPAVVAEAAQPFVGQPASRANLQALTQAMSEAYARSDVALFTVVIPRQNLAAGDLQVMVAEGYLQSVVLQGEVEGRKLKLVKAYADKLTRERPTSRARLERYLSLIRDIPGLKVDPRLELGQGRGAVRLVLKLDYERPRLTMAFDNRTSQLVDGGVIEARGVAYGALREGDRTEVIGMASIDFKDQLYVGLSHSTPIGTEGGRFGISYGHLETRASGFDISGKADTLGLTFTYPFIRSYKRNLTGTLALDGVNNDNTAVGSLIISERTRAARAALGYSLVGQRRVLSAGITVSQGLDMLGARMLTPQGKLDFFKVNARAGLNHAIGKRAVVRLNASGQWSSDPLPAVERFAVGGETFGRAFENALISADRGVAGAAELAFRPLRKGRFAQSEVYTFVDYAVIDLLNRPGFIGRDFDLGSAGGGIRLQYGEKTMIGLEAANTIDSPYAGYDSEWRFSVTWRLSLRP